MPIYAPKTEEVNRVDRRMEIIHDEEIHNVYTSTSFY
jgi:hypothetical protein